MKPVSPVRGMRDFLPAEKERRERAVGVIRSTFSSYGYREIETPALEELSRLTSGLGGENEKMIFAVLRRGLDSDAPVLPRDAVDLGLRFDLTLPLARFFASNAASLGDTIRVMQVAPVWRAERPQRGRFRQFLQCDIDIIGEASALAEAELIVAMNATLRALGITNSFTRINDREILYGLMEYIGLSRDAFDRALITIDKIDKIGIDGVIDELRSKLAVGVSSTDLLKDLLLRFQDLSDQSDFDAVVRILPDVVSQSARDRMYSIREAVNTAAPHVDLRLDISLVRGMGYYTGPIFEVGHPSSSSSIAGGGRYDRMIGRFLGKEVAACGFSIGFERILEMINLPTDSQQSVGIIYDEGYPIGKLLQLEVSLVNAGYRTRLIRAAKRRSSQLGRLYDEGFRHVVYAERVEVSADIPMTPLHPDSKGQNE